MLAGGRIPPAHLEIEALSNEIAQWRVSELSLSAEPCAAPPLLADKLPEQTGRPVCADGDSDADTDGNCGQVCKVANSICDNADRICELAQELGNDDWAAGKCTSAKGSCQEASQRCCDCRTQ